MRNEMRMFIHQLDIAQLSAAIRLDPHNADAYQVRGYAHFHLKDYERAIADYTEAIRLDPDDAIARENRDAASRDLRQRNDARDDPQGTGSRKGVDPNTY